jgi:hypothetical protein
MYPLNNVATRLQVQNSAAKDQRAYRGTLDTFQRLVREEGVLSLYAYALPFPTHTHHHHHHHHAECLWVCG